MPKGDEAPAKLRLVIGYYFAGKSKRFVDGLKKNIDGSWDTSAALTHRKDASREEAEACFATVAAIFEVFSFIIPA